MLLKYEVVPSVTPGGDVGVGVAWKNFSSAPCTMFTIWLQASIAPCSPYTSTESFPQQPEHLRSVSSSSRSDSIQALSPCPPTVRLTQIQYPQLPANHPRRTQSS